jgi:tetrahydromethanopterin S-methyltransferase subunit H
MTKKNLLKIGIALSGMASVQPTVSALAQSTDMAAANVSADEAAAAKTALLASIGQAIANLPSDASQADIEAAIAYAIDQSQAPLAVVIAVLEQVSASQASRSGAQRALANLLDAKNRLASGTGAIGADDALFGTDSDLAATPVGGGNSNYS